MFIYEFEGKAPVIPASTYVADNATIIGDVTIGENCYIGPNAVIRADELPIVIGDESAVEDGVIIHVGGKRKSTGCFIGRRVTIGHGAIVHANRVADGANIGMGAIVSLYSEVGEYAVVAEGAVVKQGQVIPPKVIVGGAPAKILRALEDRDINLWEKSKDFYIETTKKCLDPQTMKRIL